MDVERAERGMWFSVNKVLYSAVTISISSCHVVRSSCRGEGQSVTCETLFGQAATIAVVAKLVMA